MAGGLCVVVGDARCVWDDLASLGLIDKGLRGSVKTGGDAPDYMCVNMIGLHFPGPVAHWYSNDGAWLEKLAQCRRPEWESVWPVGHLHTRDERHPVGTLWPWSGPGTSGLNAALTACALDYDEIVLAGIPLDDSGHNGEPDWRATNFLREARDETDGSPNRHWIKARDNVFAGRVRSCSGRTREWLGAP